MGMDDVNPRTASPDEIAHRIVVNTGSPARFYLQDETLTVPTEPYRRGSPPTTELPIPYFDAVIERVAVEDGGLNIAGFSGIHLSASEWKRTGLNKHWEADDAAVGEPFSNTDRRLELWASREEAFYDSDPDSWSFEHLEPIPASSPLIKEWSSHDDTIPDRPPVPLSYPALSLYVLHAVDSDPHTQGRDRIEVGTVSDVSILDDLAEWPEEPSIESPDIDLSPPPRHPEIEFADLDPMPCSSNVLEAVFTINRHAKRLDVAADHAYAIDDGAEARVHSLRKTALYRVKTVAIHRLGKAAPDDIRVVLHALDSNTEMYCFYIDDQYSFHQPKDAVAEQLLSTLSDTAIDVAKSIDFEPPSATDSLDMSLGEALDILADHGLNANEYLDSTTVRDYDWGTVISTQFSSLPDGE